MYDLLGMGFPPLSGGSLPWAGLQLFPIPVGIGKDLQTALNSTGVTAGRYGE
ncbi:hypothetical protein [Alkalicoccus daliensis]|uniref:Uncharacterized protein n=1 Tax=Alkalicoccus daliensis TaxID=745820 RepID=A0A1H0IMT2_9BACI|nr:hypothetical protein [Alkalicoccus daliensis]SDO32713.1 hypothetical protein SAMN04488053_11132 [Alkalicoccus daliensis]